MHENDKNIYTLNVMHIAAKYISVIYNYFKINNLKHECTFKKI